MTMNTLTNDQVISQIQSFSTEFEAISISIRSNNSKIEEYHAFEKYLKMIQVPDHLIIDIYLGCGFSSWNELYLELRKPIGTRNNKSISCSIGKIKGVTSAVQSFLDNELRRLQTKDVSVNYNYT